MFLMTDTVSCVNLPIKWEISSTQTKEKRNIWLECGGESITCSEGYDDRLFLGARVQLAARFRVLELMKVLMAAAFFYQRGQCWWYHPLCHQTSDRASDVVICYAIKEKRTLVCSIGCTVSTLVNSTGNVESRLACSVLYGLSWSVVCSIWSVIVHCHMHIRVTFVTSTRRLLKIGDTVVCHYYGGYSWEYW